MDDKLVSLQDDCLLDIGSGKPIPQDSLRKLPPWRAVMIAKVALRAGAMTPEAYQELKDEAIQIGGNGKFKEIR